MTFHVPAVHEKAARGKHFGEFGKNHPSGAKAPGIVNLYGTAKAVPFQNRPIAKVDVALTKQAVTEQAGVAA